MNGLPVPAPATPPPSLWERLKTFGISFTVLSGLATGLTYGLLYESYVIFYSRFGVNPEEAGLDRNAILSQAIWLPLLALLFEIFWNAVVLVLAVSIGASLYAVVWWFLATSPERPFARTFGFCLRAVKDWRVAAAALLAVTFFSAGVVFHQMRHEADIAAYQVKHEGDVFSWWAPQFKYPLLNRVWTPSFEMKLRSESVAVDWHDHKPASFPSDSNCLDLIGVPGSIGIVVDISSGVVWRIPSADATFQTRLNKTAADALVKCAEQRYPPKRAG